MQHERRFYFVHIWSWLERVCLILIGILIAVIVMMIAHAAYAQSTTTAVDPRVALGLVPAEVLEGARLFFHETFAGNGRTCGTCHPAEDNFTIDASEIRRRPPSDLIFAPTVPGLERPDLLRSHGLVQENADGFDRPPVFRSTPHTLSLATSIRSFKDVPPGTDTVGWDGRGAPGAGTLRDFATGAVIQHFTKSLERRPGIDFRLPTDRELDAMLAFQLALGRTEDIELEEVRFSDPQAERGRLIFEDDGNATNINCERCHDQAGANRLDGSGNQNKDTGVDELRVAGLPHDDGRGFPGDETFSPPPIIEAADTGPFFHVHTVSTLEAAVMFYTTPLFTGQRQTFTVEQGADMAAMLRALNASLNAQMAMQRLDAAQLIEDNFPGDPVVDRLLELAQEEAIDGASVLMGHLNDAENRELLRCAQRARQAENKDGFKRTRRIGEALESCTAAQNGLGTGLTMSLGAGNLAP